MGMGLEGRGGRKGLTGMALGYCRNRKTVIKEGNIILPKMRWVLRKMVLITSPVISLIILRKGLKG
jgi:hypothetical protein